MALNPQSSIENLGESELHVSECPAARRYPVIVSSPDGATKTISPEEQEKLTTGTLPLDDSSEITIAAITTTQRAAIEESLRAEEIAKQEEAEIVAERAAAAAAETADLTELIAAAEALPDEDEG